MHRLTYGYALIALLISCKPAAPTMTVIPTPPPPNQTPGSDFSVPFLTLAMVEGFVKSTANPLRLKRNAFMSATRATLVERLRERNSFAVEFGFADGYEFNLAVMRITLAESHLRREEGRIMGVEEMRATIAKLENELVGETDADTIARKQLIIDHCRSEREVLKQLIRA